MSTLHISDVSHDDESSTSTCIVKRSSSRGSALEIAVLKIARSAKVSSAEPNAALKRARANENRYEPKPYTSAKHRIYQIEFSKKRGGVCVRERESKERGSHTFVRWITHNPPSKMIQREVGR